MIPNNLRQGDVVHVEATVEVDAGVAVGLIIKGSRGVDHTVRVHKSILKHHERGPLRPGDKVFKKLKSGRVEGEVVHRVDGEAWVRWGDDAHTVESVAGLSR